MEQRPDEAYPKEPNYDLFSDKSAAPGEAAEEASAPAVKVRVTPQKRSGGVIALCIVATLLLVIVTVACAIIIHRAVVVPNSTGEPMATSDSGALENPFARPPETTSTA
ncbi:MAG: hypothetical protein IKC99_01270, partial [Clostridia bacterium]|nr:hypothetical protein [Clostridia bacterium]